MNKALSFASVFAFVVACSSNNVVPTPPSPPVDNPSPVVSGSSNTPDIPAPATTNVVAPPTVDSGVPTKDAGLDSGSTNDAGNDASDSGDAGIATLATCLSTCEAAHPAGVILGAAIDDCWAKSCPACAQAVVGQSFTNNTCGATPVVTPSQECSDCAATLCCDSWTACFTNADCTALNTCSIDCYNRFPGQ